MSVIVKSFSAGPGIKRVIGDDDGVRVTAVVEAEDLFRRETQLGIQKQKHPVLPEIHERVVAWLFPPFVPCVGQGR